MSGIYIHIPFCKKACHYCNFHFSTSLTLKNEMVSAICKEVSLRFDYLENKKLSSIYFGGGTPSLLSHADLESIFYVINKYFTYDNNCEITLEANPDDINVSNLKMWGHAGINRLSIGIQSFFNEDLQWMNRAHTASEATVAILNAQDAGFNNITIDLIYGSPTTTNEMWISNIEKALNYNIPHISSYCLTVEEKTALHHQISKGKTKPPDSEKANEQFDYLIKSLTDHQYDHYEISNFGKPGHHAIHNTNYWKGVPYLGLGPSAHSFNKESRSWNIAHNKKYIDSVASSNDYFETEILSSATKYNEYIMTGLRTMWGVEKDNINKIDSKFGNYFETIIENYIQSGHVAKTENNYLLTGKGKKFADKIAMELFWVD